jgi:hypothetical protein
MESRILPLILISLAAFLVVPIVVAQTEDITESTYWPCDSCHPHKEVSDKLPIRSHKEQSDLKIHDKLGEGRKACRACHLGDEDPSQLRLIDGTTVSIVDEVPRLCYQCHQRKYKMWEEGAHGAPPKCTTVGCHNPHNPRMTVEVAEERVKSTFTKVLSEGIKKKELPENLKLPWDPLPYLNYKYYPYPPSPKFPAFNLTVLFSSIVVILLLIVPVAVARRRGK